MENSDTKVSLQQNSLIYNEENENRNFEFDFVFTVKKKPLGLLFPSIEIPDKNYLLILYDFVFNTSEESNFLDQILEFIEGNVFDFALKNITQESFEHSKWIFIS